MKAFLKKLPVINKFITLRHLKLKNNKNEQQLELAINMLERQFWQHLKHKQNHSENTGAAVIISLTSFGERINKVHLTLLSLLNQSVSAENIILWLSQAEFTQSVLPEPLKKLQDYGITINYCDDLGSYKKLIPTLAQYSNKTIVTVDDDVIYPSDHLKKLINQAKQYPECIICHHAREIVIDHKGNILPYNKWPHVKMANKPHMNILPVGMGGVLYPANSLHDEVLAQDKFVELAPKADDLWFKAMAVKNNTLAMLVEDPMPYENYLLIPNTQQKALWHENKINNDQQLQAILRCYPEVEKALVYTR